jgi:hypothetical protein
MSNYIENTAAQIANHEYDVVEAVEIIKMK